MFVGTGLWDSQVQYWEPAKYVARLRAHKTDDNLLVFRTQMEAGHGGARAASSALRARHDQVAVIELENAQGRGPPAIFVMGQRSGSGRRSRYRDRPASPAPTRPVTSVKPVNNSVTR
jgi:hypothetical protein